MNELGNQFGSAIIISQLLEYLKNVGWFGLLTPTSSDRVKILFGFIAALITSLGISYTFDYDPNAGGSLILHLPALHTLIDIAKQWAFQQFIYNTGVKDKSEPTIQYTFKPPSSLPSVDIQGNHTEGGH